MLTQLQGVQKKLLPQNLNHSHNRHVVVLGMLFFGICIVHGFLNLDLRGRVKLEVVIVEIVEVVILTLAISKVTANP
jgi:hypothetical protein